MKTTPKCLYCQACGIQFTFFSACKKHMYGAEHKQRIAKLFQTAPNQGAVHFPQLVVQEYLMRPNRYHAVIGLHLVTACIETGVGDPPFYLCHPCQEKCASSQIVQHLTSPDHHLAYFAHVSPEKLPFGWMSSTAKPMETHAAAELEERQCGTGVLRLLELPKPLFRAVRGLSYSQAMKQIFSTDDCKQCLEGQHVEPFSLQKYCKDANRTYPLLGLQFLVELCCINGSSPSCYLCLLCQKKVPQSHVVAHLVSFDHLFGYLDQMHPSSLESKSKYKVHSPVFRAMILHLAQQAEQSLSSADVQVMKVDAEVYEQVETVSFLDALEKLQEIRREQNLGDLQPQVILGDRLVCRRKRKRTTSPGRSVKKKEGDVNADGCSSPGGPLWSPEHTKTGPADSYRVVCRLVCQNCDPGVLYGSVKSYKQHVRSYPHQQCVERLFPDLDKAACVRPQQRVPIPSLNVYGSLIDQLRTEPLIGLHLVTVCITFSSKPPVYLCHACEEAIPSQEDVHHLTSAEHYFSTLASDDPEALPFGWIHPHDALSVLKPRAVVEEKRQSKSVLQMLCVPDRLFVEIKGGCYSTAMKKLQHAVKLMAGLKAEEKVVLPEYLSNPKRKFPLLGLQFLVKYRSTGLDESSGYLCLLCQKKFRQNQTVLHAISFDHLFAYLESTRPLSLGVKSDYKQYDAKHRETMLDLASRALITDSPGEIQEVQLEPDVFQEVCRSTFVDALKKLQTFWKEKSQGDPQPQAPLGQRTADAVERTEEAAAAVCPATADGPRVCAATGAVCQGVAKNPLPNQVLVPEPKANEPESVEGIGSDPTAVSLTEVEQESLTNRGEDSPKELKSLNSINDLSNQEFAQYPRVLPELILDPNRAQTTTGSIGESNWSKFWFLDGRPYPSIGLEAVVECRCLKHPTVYLCLTCTEQITSSNICDHVISRRHQYHYIKSLYPELLHSWRDDPDETAWLVYHHDRTWDVQVVKLRPAAYQRIVSAPFYMAVQMIREEHDPYEPRPLITLEDVLDTGASGIAQKQPSRLDARCATAGCCSWQSVEQGQDAYRCCRPQPHAKAADGMQATLFTDRSLQKSVQPQASDSCETRKSLSPECPGSVQLVGTDTKTLTEKVLTAWKEMTEKAGGM